MWTPCWAPFPLHVFMFNLFCFISSSWWSWLCIVLSFVLFCVAYGGEARTWRVPPPQFFSQPSFFTSCQHHTQLPFPFVLMWVVYCGHHGCVGAPHFVISCCTWRFSKDAQRNVDPCSSSSFFCHVYFVSMNTTPSYPSPLCYYVSHSSFALQFVIGVMCNVSIALLCIAMNNMDMRNVDP